MNESGPKKLDIPELERKLKVFLEKHSISISEGRIYDAALSLAKVNFEELMSPSGDFTPEEQDFIRVQMAKNS